MERPQPDANRFYNNGLLPHSVPMQMPDRYEHPQTMLYGPHGESLIIRRPRHFGFRPIEEKK